MYNRISLSFSVVIVETLSTLYIRRTVAFCEVCMYVHESNSQICIQTVA